MDYEYILIGGCEAEKGAVVKNVYRVLLLAFCLGGVAGQAQAGIFSDDFNRADVAATTNGADIGSGYVISSVSYLTNPGRFQIIGNELAPGSGGGTNIVLNYQGFQAKNTAGNSFQASIDITLGTFAVGINPGLVFNFQNATNFYYARISSGATPGAGVLQYGQIVNGVAAAFTGAMTGLNVETGKVYTLTVASNTAGTFSITLKGGSVDIGTMVIDTAVGGDFTDGYVGIYQIISNSNTRFDNFAVNTASASKVQLFLISSL